MLAGQIKGFGVRRSAEAQTPLAAAQLDQVHAEDATSSSRKPCARGPNLAMGHIGNMPVLGCLFSRLAGPMPRRIEQKMLLSGEANRYDSASHILAAHQTRRSRS
jgi:hypothetical protein